MHMTAECEESLQEKTVQWKSGLELEAKGLKTNTGTRSSAQSADIDKPVRRIKGQSRSSNIVTLVGIY